jgi:HSP20 family protein
MTTSVLRYRNFPEFDELPTSLRLFQDSIARMLNESGARPWTPAVDVWETENELVMTVDVPGIRQEDIDVRLENGTLTIKGERRFESASDSKGYHRIERSYGTFARTFSLPETVDPEKVNAEYKEGVLTISIAKKEVAKPRSIKVQVAGEPAR